VHAWLMEDRTHSCASSLIARDGTLASEQNVQLIAQRIGIDQRLDALQGTRIMDTDRKLGAIAANLDDMSETLAELNEVHRVYRRVVSVSECGFINGQRKSGRRLAACPRNIDAGVRMPPSAPAAKLAKR
jgi:hypothetical protein